MQRSSCFADLVALVFVKHFYVFEVFDFCAINRVYDILRKSVVRYDDRKVSVDIREFSERFALALLRQFLLKIASIEISAT